MAICSSVNLLFFTALLLLSGSHKTGKLALRPEEKTGGTSPLPITQAEVGDALGLSTVHVNRTLQELRKENLVEWERGVLTVLDWEGLTLTGEFDPTYLHQDPKHLAA